MKAALPSTYTAMPLNLGQVAKRDVRTQFGALVYRMRGDKPQVLLITSRGSRRWIIPKGWPMDGLTPTEAAAQEAWEEAGVRGKSSDACLGVYSYVKEHKEDTLYPCLVMVYPLKAKSWALTYPEKAERKRKWFSLKKAAKHVAEPELAQIIRDFDPAALG